MARSVLVIDDDDGFRSLLMEMVRAVGVPRVRGAATVAGALSAVGEARPEVAIIDIGLPDGDGLQLAAELARLADPPRVLLISANPHAASDAALERVGAVALVAKHDLDGASLRRLLDGR